MNIKNFIESIGLEKIKVNSIEKIEDYEVITIEGGLNGTGTLDYYLDQVKIIEEELTGLCSEKWLISWVNDCLDDVWTLKLGVRQYENLNSESSNENSTVEIYNDKDELMRHNAELVLAIELVEIYTSEVLKLKNVKNIMKNELGNRMKSYYENRSKTFLARRTPVIIRLDGKAFHTFTKGFEKPFDSVMVKAMQDTMKYLCENIQGCVLGYTQSDEITLVLVDYNKLDTDAWFDYDVQKLCSVSASMATFAFNRSFAKIAMLNSKDRIKYTNAYSESSYKGAMFDSRCFNVPVEEVTNCILWRQQDATRNSIHAVGQVNFSHKELHGLSTNQIQELLFSKCKINWNDFPTHLKRGCCCIKKEDGWYIDEEIPIFKGEDRNYVEKLINYE